MKYDYYLGFDVYGHTRLMRFEKGSKVRHSFQITDNRWLDCGRFTVEELTARHNPEYKYLLLLGPLAKLLYSLDFEEGPV